LGGKCVKLGNHWKKKELIKMGMPKEAAKRIGAKYAALKDDTINAMKRSFSGFGSSI